MAKKGMPIEGGYYVHYGNAADYLARRIARDRPDILQEMKDGKYCSVRRAAIAAGIIDVPSDEDKALVRLYEAWRKAGLEDRRLFLMLMADEIEAASNGHYLNLAPIRRGPHPFVPNQGAEIPELETLIQSGATVSGIAQQLGVSYRTICRWRSGQSHPSLEKRHGVSADRLYGFGHIILQSHRRGSVGVSGALVADVGPSDRGASATRYA